MKRFSSFLLHNKSNSVFTCSPIWVPRWCQSHAAFPTKQISYHLFGFKTSTWIETSESFRLYTIAGTRLSTFQKAQISASTWSPSQTSIRHFPLFSTTRSYNEKYLFDFLPEDHVIPIRTIGSNLLFQPARDRHQKPAIRHLKILQLNNRVRMMKTK